jgi:hypothetical protein
MKTIVAYITGFALGAAIMIPLATAIAFAVMFVVLVCISFIAWSAAPITLATLALLARIAVSIAMFTTIAFMFSKEYRQWLADYVADYTK